VRVSAGNGMAQNEARPLTKLLLQPCRRWELAHVVRVEGRRYGGGRVMEDKRVAKGASECAYAIARILTSEDLRLVFSADTCCGQQVLK